jgi:alpha-amylase
MTRRPFTRIVAAVVPVALVLAVSQMPSASAAAVGVTSVTVAGSFNSELGCTDDWSPPCPAAHLTARADGKFEGTFTIPESTDGQPYQYKFATNDDFNNPNFGLQGGSGNIVLRIPGGGATVTFVFDPVSNLGSDSINSVALSGDFQTQLGCPSNDDRACPQSWLYDIDGDGVFTLSTGSIAAGTYHVSAITGLGTGDTAGPTTFTVPTAGGGATTTISFASETHNLSTSVVPLVQPPPVAFGHPTARRGDVIANLWEWNWKSIARECTSVLGPAGYGAVQVAPPENSINNPNSTTKHPWWEVYQPVDYSLNSRFGNEADFQAMVATCREAGVDVIVDTVINHMTAQGTTSYGSSNAFTKYDYPGLYAPADFHTNADCPEPSNTIDDFNDYLQVTECELVGLSDLRTESESVRTTIAGYLNKLLSYGVAGFRVDAAKHIGQADLTAIFQKLNRTLDGRRPFVALEVPPGGPGKLSPFAFQAQGDLLGFDFATSIKAAFTSNITDLTVFGADAGLLPSRKSVPFVQNHDSERDGSTLNYKNGATNTLATEFMLAYRYGTPQVYSGFAFAGRDDSPPSDTNGFVTDTDCDNGWVCTHRSQGVANLVDFHNFVGSAPVRNMYDDGDNLIAFSRGSRGWIAINNHSTPQIHTFQTGLPAGAYCDVIHGTFSKSGDGNSCTGPTVAVGADGTATVTIPAQDSVAFNAANRVRTQS